MIDLFFRPVLVLTDEMREAALIERQLDIDLKLRKQLRQQGFVRLHKKAVR